MQAGWEGEDLTPPWGGFEVGTHGGTAPVTLQLPQMGRSPGDAGPQGIPGGLSLPALTCPRSAFRPALSSVAGHR